MTGRPRRRAATPFDLLAASFPGGSITGAPKIRAMEILEGLEPVRRGPYTGAIGWIGPDGAMQTSILIRTFVADGRRLTLHVGGGITWKSDPAAEWDETVAKARGPLGARSAAWRSGERPRASAATSGSTAASSRPTARTCRSFDRGFQLGDGIFETLRVRGAPRDGARRAHRPAARVRRRPRHRRSPTTSTTGWRAGDRRPARRRAASTDRPATHRSGSRSRAGRSAVAGCCRPTRPSRPRSRSRPGRSPPPPAGHLERGLHLVASAVRRDPENPLATLKTTSRADYVYARLEARRAGADDALFLTIDGYLSEGTTANIFLVRRAADDVVELATPSLDCAILPGTTRSWLLRWARARSGCGRSRVGSRRPTWPRPTRRSCLERRRDPAGDAFDGEPIGDGRPGPWTLRARADREAMIAGEEDAHDPRRADRRDPPAGRRGRPAARQPVARRRSRCGSSGRTTCSRRRGGRMDRYHLAWLMVGKPKDIVRGRPMTADEEAAYVREVAEQKTAALRMSLDAVERQGMPFVGETGGVGPGRAARATGRPRRDRRAGPRPSSPADPAPRPRRRRWPRRAARQTRISTTTRPRAAPREDAAMTDHASRPSAARATVPVPDPIARDYILLGLRLDQHIPGLVDGYFGPADLKAAVDMEQLRSPAAPRATTRPPCATGSPPRSPSRTAAPGSTSSWSRSRPRPRASPASRCRTSTTSTRCFAFAAALPGRPSSRRPRHASTRSCPATRRSPTGSPPGTPRFVVPVDRLPAVVDWLVAALPRPGRRRCSAFPTARTCGSRW